ncbi:hypothetical protein O6H91_02G100700 [Diphasiastrum complanatum]|uniref:Uncharacterized protein n=1 Tax=Diphasiastrum complanatum TaxID=34168 RepID=A0ACC2EIJ7_DIPCM|nr:hypothetical protein O6H91_02G100700 [Diphasiastrum complanatum]
MAMALCTRSAARLLRLSSTPLAPACPSNSRHVRGFSSEHGPAKVNLWEAPLKPALWKEEHFVFVSLAGWGLIFYGGYKAFSGGKPEESKKD